MCGGEDGCCISSFPVLSVHECPSNGIHEVEGMLLGLQVVPCVIQGMLCI